MVSHRSAQVMIVPQECFELMAVITEVNLFDIILRDSLQPFVKELRDGELFTDGSGGCPECSRQSKDLCAFAEEMVIMVDVQQPRGTALAVRSIGRRLCQKVTADTYTPCPTRR